MEELKQKLIEDCQTSGLPLEAILFVTKDLWRDIDDTLRMAKENTARQQEIEKAKKEGEE